MLLRAIFAAVLHIATSLNASYNHLIFSATVFKTLDAATEHGPKLTAFVGRVVPLTLSGSPRVPAISSNASNTANVYVTEIFVVVDTVSHTSAPAPAPTTVATASDNVCFLPTVVELLSTDSVKTSLPVRALSTDVVNVVEVVIREPAPSLGELLLYDEEYALQQRRDSSIWASIDWDTIISAIIISAAVYWLCKKALILTIAYMNYTGSASLVKPAADAKPTNSSTLQPLASTQVSSSPTPTPTTPPVPRMSAVRRSLPRPPRRSEAMTTPDEIYALLGPIAPSPDSASNVTKVSIPTHESTAFKDASAADPSERPLLSGSEDCVEPPYFHGTAPSPYTTHHAYKPSAVVDASITDRVEQTQLPADRLEASDISVVVPTPHTIDPKPTAPVNAVTDQLEPLLAAGGVDTTGAPSYDDEALSASQGESSYIHPLSAESSNSDKRVEEATSQVESPACEALDSAPAVKATTQPTAAPEELDLLGAATNYPTTTIWRSTEEPLSIDSEVAKDDTEPAQHDSLDSVIANDAGENANGQVSDEDEDEEVFDYAKAKLAQDCEQDISGIHPHNVAADASQDQEACEGPANDGASGCDDDEDFDYETARAELARECSLAGDQDAAVLDPAVVPTGSSVEVSELEDNAGCVTQSTSTTPTETGSERESTTLLFVTLSAHWPIVMPASSSEPAAVELPATFAQAQPTPRPSASAPSKPALDLWSDEWPDKQTQPTSYAELQALRAAPTDATPSPPSEPAAAQPSFHAAEAQPSPAPASAAPPHKPKGSIFDEDWAANNASRWPQSYAECQALSARAKPEAPPAEQTTPTKAAQVEATVLPLTPPKTPVAPPPEQTRPWGSQSPAKSRGHAAWMARQQKALDNSQQHQSARPDGPSGNDASQYQAPPPPYQANSHPDTQPIRTLIERVSPRGPPSPYRPKSHPVIVKPAYASDPSCFTVPQPKSLSQPNPSPPPTPPKQTDVLKPSNERQRCVKAQQQSEPVLMCKATAIQCVRMLVARMNLKKQVGGRKMNCDRCNNPLPDKCSCDLLRYAPRIADVERWLEATRNWPPARLRLVQSKDCGEAEIWLQHKALQYLQDAARRRWLPAVRKPILDLVSNSHRDVRILLSEKLVPVYLFSSYTPGGVTQPVDVNRATRTNVLDAERVTEFYGHTAIFTIYGMLKCRTPAWGGDERNARQNRRG
ncbi:hypothetical protein PENSPDRAFT_648245 [Peniophora sp. CONT]|nr:hypothetical protein PENSPDRAFT_648245 [Peniophora sp. CONT]